MAPRGARGASRAQGRPRERTEGRRDATRARPGHRENNARESHRPRTHQGGPAPKARDAGRTTVETPIAVPPVTPQDPTPTHAQRPPDRRGPSERPRRRPPAVPQPRRGEGERRGERPPSASASPRAGPLTPSFPPFPDTTCSSAARQAPGTPKTAPSGRLGDPPHRARGPRGSATRSAERRDGTPSPREATRTARRRRPRCEHRRRFAAPTLGSGSGQRHFSLIETPPPGTHVSRGASGGRGGHAGGPDRSHDSQRGTPTPGRRLGPAGPSPDSDEGRRGPR